MNYLVSPDLVHLNSKPVQVIELSLRVQSLLAGTRFLFDGLQKRTHTRQVSPAPSTSSTVRTVHLPENQQSFKQKDFADLHFKRFRGFHLGHFSVAVFSKFR